MLSVKAHLQCSELPLLQSTLEKVDLWDISSPQKTADEVSWRCWWKPVSFSLCCFHNLQEPSPLQPWQALAPDRPQRTAGMKKQGAGLPWGIGRQPAQLMERRLGQRLLTRVLSAEEARWSGTGRENPSGCPQPLTGPQTQQASTQRLWQLRQSVQPPLGNPPPHLGEEMGKGTRRHRGQHLLSATRPTWRQPFATNIRESRLTFFPWASAARPFPPSPAAAQSSSGKMAQPPGEWGGPPRWPRLFPSLPLWPGCVSLCAAAPLKDMKLMDVKLGQLPTWLAMRDFTPGGILGALRRGEGGWGEGARPPCRNSSAPPRPAKTWRVWIPSPDGARQISA